MDNYSDQAGQNLLLAVILQSNLFLDFLVIIRNRYMKKNFLWFKIKGKIIFKNFLKALCSQKLDWIKRLQILRNDKWQERKNKMKWSQTYVVTWWVIIGPCLNTICNKTQNCSNPEQHRKSSKQGLAKFDPFRCGFRWGKAIGSITQENFFCFFWTKTLKINKQIFFMFQYSLKTEMGSSKF